MTAAAYIRVSSASQDHGMQRAAIERAAAARGDTIGEWFAEKRSGKTTARPSLDEMRFQVRAGHFRRLYVFRLDRLTRSGIRDMFEVIEELKSNGCEVVTIADGFDLNGPAAEVVLAVLAWAAKMERLAINERISAARERMREQGKPWGRPSRCDDVQRKQIRKLRKNGMSLRRIAMFVGVPTTTVRRELGR